MLLPPRAVYDMVSLELVGHHGPSCAEPVQSPSEVGGRCNPAGYEIESLMGGKSIV